MFLSKWEFHTQTPILMSTIAIYFSIFNRFLGIFHWKCKNNENSAVLIACGSLNTKIETIDKVEILEKQKTKKFAVPGSEKFRCIIFLIKTLKWANIFRKQSRWIFFIFLVNETFIEKQQQKLTNNDVFFIASHWIDGIDEYYFWCFSIFRYIFSSFRMLLLFCFLGTSLWNKPSINYVFSYLLHYIQIAHALRTKKQKLRNNISEM